MAFINDFRFGDIGVLPSPSGPLGSKTNPYKINKLTSRGYNVYIPENSVEDNWGRGALTIPQSSKLYFEIDPIKMAGGPVSAVGVKAQFFEGAGGVCKLIQDKITGAYSSEVCFGSDSLIEVIYDGQPYKIDNTKFLYALVGSPDGDLHEAVEVTIIPYTDAEVAAQPTTPVESTTPYWSETTEPEISNAGELSQVVLGPSTTTAKSSIAGFPTWGWIALAGVGAFILFGRGRKKVG